MRTKRGFTLFELLVVIAISSIMLGAIGTAFAFVTNTASDMLLRSERIAEAQTVENYLRSLIKDGEEPSSLLKNGKNEIKVDSGDLIKGSETILTDTGIISISIKKDDDDGFIRCTLKYEDMKFEFILDYVGQQGGQVTQGEQ